MYALGIHENIFLPLAEHLLRRRPLIRENFDRHPGIAN